jgi:AraC-like DNA-binding protein
MDRCYNHPLDLHQLSRHASFSRYYFIRLFRKTYKRTPHQYLTHRRIEKAKELLAATDRTVTEVCFAVGFQSLGSFSALFHKFVGYSPTEYRARILERRRHPHRYIPGCFLSMCGIRRPAGS